MRKKAPIPCLLTILFIWGVIALTISCGAQRTYQTSPPTEGLARYVIIEIPDFKSTLTYVPPDSLWTIPNEIADKLKKEQTFVGVSRAPLDVTEGVMIMEGDIIKLEPREWYEQAVRTVKVGAHVRFLDKSDNRVIAEATFEGTSKAGAVSGGVPFAFSRLADEIVRYINSNYTP